MMRTAFMRNSFSSSERLPIAVTSSPTLAVSSVKPAAMVRDSVTLAVQVNGKLRGTIEAAPDAPREAIEAAALAEPNVARFLEGQAVRKVIVVPGKIVNIVAAG